MITPPKSVDQRGFATPTSKLTIGNNLSCPVKLSERKKKQSQLKGIVASFGSLLLLWAHDQGQLTNLLDSLTSLLSTLQSINSTIYQDKLSLLRDFNDIGVILQNSAKMEIESTLFQIRQFE